MLVSCINTTNAKLLIMGFQGWNLNEFSHWVAPGNPWYQQHNCVHLAPPCPESSLTGQPGWSTPFRDNEPEAAQIIPG